MNVAFSTTNDLFYKRLKSFGNRKALFYKDESLTYNELLSKSIKLANRLKKLDVTVNTQVALYMSNRLEYAISDIAIILAGAAKVPLNTMLNLQEIEFILNNSEARVLIVEEQLLDKLLKVRNNLQHLQHVIVISNEDHNIDGLISWHEIQQEESDEYKRVDVQPTDRGLVMYTGGTTGTPKGVVHNNQNIVINMYSHIIELEFNENERLLLTSPLPHSAGLLMQAGLLSGARSYIENSYSPRDVIERIEKDKITFLFMVPTMIYRLLDTMGDDSYDFSSLNTILYGAAPITINRLKEGLRKIGPVFMQLYGQTESPNFITRLTKETHINAVENNEKLLKSCGKEVLMASVKVVDDNGEELKNGEIGEIIAKTPYVMNEYYKAPDKTDETLKEGWLFTGDLGYKDDEGYIYLVDRKNDMIISGGMNVYPKEVENTLHQHLAISQAVVVGLPDSDWGERVVAVIIKKDGMEVTEKELVEYCREYIAAYKRPKEYIFTDSVPLTPYGKIDKKELKKQLQQKEMKS